MNYKLKYFLLFQIIIVFVSIIIFSINNNFNSDISKNIFLIFNKQINLNNLGFFYGELIENYFNHNSFYINLDDTKLFVGRPLYIAFFLSILIKFISLEFFILLLKNSIFFSIYYFSVCEFFKKNKFNNYKFFLLICAPFIIPYNLYQSFQLIPEESYLIYLIPSLFLCIISESKNKIFLTFLFISILFTKSPNVILVLSLTILIYSKTFKINSRNLIFISVIITSILWGGYGYYKSQIFTFFHKSYTVNAFTGLQSHNIFFKYFYPEYTVDEITSYFNFFKQNPDHRSEKNYEKILNDEKKKYVKENFSEYLNNKITTIKHILLNVRRDGSQFTEGCKHTFSIIMSRMQSDGIVHKMKESEKELMLICKNNSSNEIRLNFVINKFLWIISIIIALLNILFFKKNIKLSFLLIFINFFYLVPFVYGHIYTRHLIILFVLSIIFLILNFNSLINNKKL